MSLLCILLVILVWFVWAKSPKANANDNAVADATAHIADATAHSNTFTDTLMERTQNDQNKTANANKFLKATAKFLKATATAIATIILAITAINATATKANAQVGSNTVTRNGNPQNINPIDINRNNPIEFRWFTQLSNAPANSNVNICDSAGERRGAISQRSTIVTGAQIVLRIRAFSLPAGYSNGDTVHLCFRTAFNTPWQVIGGQTYRVLTEDLVPPEVTDFERSGDENTNGGADGELTWTLVIDDANGVVRADGTAIPTGDNVSAANSPFELRRRTSGTIAGTEVPGTTYDISESSGTYTVSANLPSQAQAPDGEYALVIPANSIRDSSPDAPGGASVGNTLATQSNSAQFFTIDRTAPTATATIGRLGNNTLTGLDPNAQFATADIDVRWNITLDGPVANNITNSDFVITATATAGGAVTTPQVSVSSVSGSPNVRIVSVGGTRIDATYALTLASGHSIEDDAGNRLVLPNLPTITLDSTRPRVVSITTTAATASTRDVQWVATFSEPVRQLTDANISFSTSVGGTTSVVGTIVGSGTSVQYDDSGTTRTAFTVYTFTTTTTGSVAEQLTVSIVGGNAIRDAVNNGLNNTTATGTNTNNPVNLPAIDTTPPTLADNSRLGGNPNNGGADNELAWTIDLVDDNDIVLANGNTIPTGNNVSAANSIFELRPVTSGTVGSTEVPNITYDITLTGASSYEVAANLHSGTPDGQYAIVIPANTIRDDSTSAPGGNGNLTTTPIETTIFHTLDTVAPTVTSIVRTSSAEQLTGGSVAWTVTFSEDVTNVNGGDFETTGLTGTTTLTIPATDTIVTGVTIAPETTSPAVEDVYAITRTLSGSANIDNVHVGLRLARDSGSAGHNIVDAAGNEYAPDDEDPLLSDAFNTANHQTFILDTARPRIMSVDIVSDGSNASAVTGTVTITFTEPVMGVATSILDVSTPASGAATGVALSNPQASGGTGGFATEWTLDLAATSLGAFTLTETNHSGTTDRAGNAHQIDSTIAAAVVVNHTVVAADRTPPSATITVPTAPNTLPWEFTVDYSDDLNLTATPIPVGANLASSPRFQLQDPMGNAVDGITYTIAIDDMATRTYTVTINNAAPDPDPTSGSGINIDTDYTLVAMLANLRDTSTDGSGPGGNNVVAAGTEVSSAATQYQPPTEFLTMSSIATPMRAVNFLVTFTRAVENDGSNALATTHFTIDNNITGSDSTITSVMPADVDGMPLDPAADSRYFIVATNTPTPASGDSAGIVTLTFANVTDLNDADGNAVAALPATAPTAMHSFRDVDPPTLESIITNPTGTSVVNDATDLSWTVRFSEPVKDVDADDFAVGCTTGGSPTILSAVLSVAPTTPAQEYTVTVMSITGTIANRAVCALGIAAGNDISDTSTFPNADGNDFSATPGPDPMDIQTITFADQPPTATFAITPPRSTMMLPFVWTVTFSHAVDTSTISEADFQLRNVSDDPNGTPVTNGVTITVAPATGAAAGTQYTVTVNEVAQDDISGGSVYGLAILGSMGATGNIADPVGNAIETNIVSASSLSYDYTAPDRTPPSFTAFSPNNVGMNGRVSAPTPSWEIQFDDTVTGLSTDDFTLTVNPLPPGTSPASIEIVQPTSSTLASWTIRVVNLPSTTTTDIELQLALARDGSATSIEDEAGNDILDTGFVSGTSTDNMTRILYNPDTTVPSLVSLAPTMDTSTTPPTISDTEFTATFSEPVVGLMTSNFVPMGVSGITVTAVSAVNPTTVNNAPVLNGDFASEWTITTSAAGFVTLMFNGSANPVTDAANNAVTTNITGVRAISSTSTFAIAGDRPTAATGIDVDNPAGNVSTITFTVTYAQNVIDAETGHYSVSCSAACSDITIMSVTTTSSTVHEVVAEGFDANASVLTYSLNGTNNYNRGMLTNVYVDNVRPTVILTRNSDTMVQAEFSKPVARIMASDFELNNDPLPVGTTLTATAVASTVTTIGGEDYATEYTLVFSSAISGNLTAVGSATGARDSAGNALAPGGALTIAETIEIVTTYVATSARNYIASTPRLTPRLSRVSSPRVSAPPTAPTTAPSAPSGGTTGTGTGTGDDLIQDQNFSANVTDISSSAYYSMSGSMETFNHNFSTTILNEDYSFNYSGEFTPYSSGSKYGFSISKDNDNLDMRYEGVLSLSSLSPYDLGPSIAPSGLELWFQTTYSKTESIDGSESDLYFLHSGIDYALSSNAVIGIMLQLDSKAESLSVPSLSQQMMSPEIEGLGWLAGPYIAAQSPRLGASFEARVAIGKSDNELNPNPSVPTTPIDEFETERFFASMSIGGYGPYRTLRGWSIKPNADYSYYSEKTIEYMNMAGQVIPSTTYVLNRLSFGPTLSRTIRLPDGSVMTPNVAISGLMDYSTDDSITGTNNSMRDVTGKVDMGLLFTGNSGFDWNIGGYYDGIGADVEVYGFTGGLRINF